MARLNQVREASSSPSCEDATEQNGLESSANASAASPTPATSLTDNGSNQGDAVKEDTMSRRSGRARVSAVYNEAQLAGTASKGHGGSKRRVSEPATRNVSGATLVNNDGDDSEGAVDAASKQLLEEGVKALNMEWEVLKRPKQPVVAETSQVQSRRSVRATVVNAASSAKEAASTLGKRGRDVYENAKESVLDAMPARRKSMREPLKHVPTPSHVAFPAGKMVVEESEDEDSMELSPAKKGSSLFPNLKKPLTEQEKIQERAKAAAAEQRRRDPRYKKHVIQGLYHGIHRQFDPSQKGKSKAKSQTDDDNWGELDSTYLPLPMFGGQRLFEQGRDFKLPYDILNPLATDEAPKDWRKLDKNRFIGDASANWRKEFRELNKESSSYCGCKPGQGCSDPNDLDSCLNRALQYECIDSNCGVGGENCLNRAFAELRERSMCKNEFRNPEKRGPNMYSEGVEAFRTENRGHGVRAMRSFEPEQVIVEYCGEIITCDEADRRMNEEYKDKNENYYLMTFHDGLIIDATRGSICRFVNHSCEPNCRVEKWLVNGEPRMALFANGRGIGVGEELTYDYNFAPFSEKNVQKCFCGTLSCRGVIGPRPANERSKVSKVVNVAKSTMKDVYRGAKRTVAKAFGGEADYDSDTTLSPHKKRKGNMPDARALISKAGRLIKPPTRDPDLIAIQPPVDLVAQIKSRGERAARRATVGEPSTEKNKPEGKLKRHSEFVIPLNGRLKTSSSLTSLEISPRRTSRTAKNKYVRTSSEIEKADRDAAKKATPTGKGVKKTATSIGPATSNKKPTVSAPKTAPIKTTSTTKKPTEQRSNPSPAISYPAPSRLPPPPTSITTSVPIFTRPTPTPTPSPKRTTLGSSLSAVLGIASRLTDHKHKSPGKLVKKGVPSPLKASASKSRTLGGALSNALIPKMRKPFEDGPPKAIDSLKKQSRISFGSAGRLGIRARSKSNTSSPAKTKSTSTSNKPSSAKKSTPAGKRRLTRSPRKAPGMTRLPSESPPQRQSTDSRRAVNKRPGTSGRPMTAVSIANSMRDTVIKSTKGASRAAAVARMGLGGDKAIRKTIRQVSGAEA